MIDDALGPLPGWYRRAQCAEMGPDLFECDLRETRRRPASSEAQIRNRQAKRVCAVCPVVEQCREHAMQLPDPLYGFVAGGLTHRERVELRRQRRAGVREGPG